MRLNLRVGLGLPLLLAFRTMWAGEPANVPMTAAYWRAEGNVTFLAHEGFPQGILDVKSGSAVLQGMNFRNGTIAFDTEIDPNATGIPSIEFRRRDTASAEEFYLRPGPDCPPSDDCVQYAPVTRGVMLWDFYPDYQASAPVRETGWNHIRLVISGRRMDVYINDELRPSLKVGELEGDTLAGGISFQGQALFANLVVTPNAVDGLSPYPASDPSAKIPGLIRYWQVSQPSTLQAGHELTISDMPSSSHPWKMIEAERGGAINLSRRYGSPVSVPAASIAWLKTTIQSDRNQDKQASIGWLRAVWVFANGKLVFAGKNYYYPSNARRIPDGRLSLENGAFVLPLRKGANEIAVGLSNDFPQGHSHYGWGLKLKLNSLTGLRLTAGK
jgi:hypothetical protein